MHYDNWLQKDAPADRGIPMHVIEDRCDEIASDQDLLVEAVMDADGFNESLYTLYHAGKSSNITVDEEAEAARGLIDLMMRAVQDQAEKELGV